MKTVLAGRVRVLVPDANVILKLVLPPENEPGHLEARMLFGDWFDGRVELVVPELWVYEAGNILCLKQPRTAAGCLTQLLQMRLQEVKLAGRLAVETAKLASAIGISYYDASYLAVAKMAHGVVVSADAKLVRKTASTGLVRPLV